MSFKKGEMVQYGNSNCLVLAIEQSDNPNNNIYSIRNILTNENFRVYQNEISPISVYKTTGLTEDTNYYKDLKENIGSNSEQLVDRLVDKTKIFTKVLDIQPKIFVPRRKTSTMEFNNEQVFSDETISIKSENLGVDFKSGDSNKKLFPKEKFEYNKKINKEEDFTVFERDSKYENEVFQNLGEKEIIHNDLTTDSSINTNNFEKINANLTQVRENLDKPSNISKNYNPKKIKEEDRSELESELNKKNKNYTIFGELKNSEEDVIKYSRTYKKFKVCSNILISFFTISIIVVIAFILTKLINFYLTFKVVNSNFIIVSITNPYNLADLISNILLIVVLPIFLLVTSIFLISFLLIFYKILFKKIAFYNVQLNKNIEIIDSMQEYNQELNKYVFKLYKDMKKLKLNQK